MGDKERRPAEIGRPGIGRHPQPIPPDRIAPGDRDPDRLGRGRRDVEGDARGEGAAAEEEKVRGLAHDRQRLQALDEVDLLRPDLADDPDVMVEFEHPNPHLVILADLLIADAQPHHDGLAQLLGHGDGALEGTQHLRDGLSWSGQGRATWNNRRGRRGRNPRHRPRSSPPGRIPCAASFDHDADERLGIAPFHPIGAGLGTEAAGPAEAAVAADTLGREFRRPHGMDDLLHRFQLRERGCRRPPTPGSCGP